MPMTYRFKSLRWSDAHAIRRWHYDDAYAFYDPDMGTLLPLVVLRLPLRAFGVEAFVVTDVTDERIGLFDFIVRGRAVEIGLAMRPDLTGKGLGLAFVEAGMAFARARYSPRRFTLDVALFNERARRVYERAGFKPVDTFTRHTRNGPVDFLAMYRLA
jgi:ribosomal-protein-alanine N-acetyltransferase